jgi:hypothetical protein
MNFLLPNEPLRVGLNLGADFKHLEIVVLHSKTGQLLKTTSISLDGCFNPNNRSIVDPDALQANLKEAYVRLNLPTKAPTTLSIPSSYSRFVALPETLSDEETKLAILSEVERSILFKRTEPCVSWRSLGYLDHEGTRRILYSAYSKPDITCLIDSFQAAGVALAGVDTHLPSVIRGLYTTGTLLQGEAKQLLCILNAGNLMLVVLEGLSILTLVEARLSADSEGEDQVLGDLKQDLESLEDLIFDCEQVLLVFSHPAIPLAKVSACFEAYPQTVIIEQTPQTLASLGSESALYPCSLEALGSAFYEDLEDLAHFNFLPENLQTSYYVNKQRKKVRGLAIAGNVLAALLVLVVWFSISLGNMGKAQELDTLKAKLTTLNNISTNLPLLVHNLWLNRHEGHGKQLLEWLLTVRKQIPASLWLDTVNLDMSTGQQVLSLSGGSQGTTGITSYVSNLKTSFMVNPINLGDVKEGKLNPANPVTASAEGGANGAAPGNAATAAPIESNLPAGGMQGAGKEADLVPYVKWNASNGAAGAAAPAAAAPAATAAPAAAATPAA